MNPPATNKPASLHLPYEARMALMRAAKTEIPPSDPMARLRAVEKAIEYARNLYPRLFWV